MYQKAADVSSQGSYITSGAALVFGGLTFNEWMMLGGLLLGVLTFISNIYFRWQSRKDKLKHYADMLRAAKESHQPGSGDGGNIL